MMIEECINNIDYTKLSIYTGRTKLSIKSNYTVLLEGKEGSIIAKTMTVKDSKHFGMLSNAINFIEAVQNECKKIHIFINKEYLTDCIYKHFENDIDDTHGIIIYPERIKLYLTVERPVNDKPLSCHEMCGTIRTVIQKDVSHNYPSERYHTRNISCITSNGVLIYDLSKIPPYYVIEDTECNSGLISMQMVDSKIAMILQTITFEDIIKMEYNKSK